MFSPHEAVTSVEQRFSRVFVLSGQSLQVLHSVHCEEHPGRVIVGLLVPEDVVLVGVVENAEVGVENTLPVAVDAESEGAEVAPGEDVD